MKTKLYVTRHICKTNDFAAKNLPCLSAKKFTPKQCPIKEADRPKVLWTMDSVSLRTLGWGRVRKKTCSRRLCLRCGRGNFDVGTKPMTTKKDTGVFKTS